MEPVQKRKKGRERNLEGLEIHLVEDEEGKRFIFFDPDQQLVKDFCDAYDTLFGGNPEPPYHKSYRIS